MATHVMRVVMLICFWGSLHPSCGYPDGAPDDGHLCQTLQPPARHHPVPPDSDEPAPFVLEIKSAKAGVSLYEMVMGWYKYRMQNGDNG